ncbi:hypothetical protein E4U40_000470 [Claviceps sp. LM458 group G5]|nr:hypothetical protein E4U40_000470 [Claviceps sp. LM458 group G5]
MGDREFGNSGQREAFWPRSKADGFDDKTCEPCSVKRRDSKSSQVYNKFERKFGTSRRFEAAETSGSQNPPIRDDPGQSLLEAGTGLDTNSNKWP